MSVIILLILLTILLVILVAGIVLTFAIVVMPGIKILNNHDFLQAFKAMDRVIQENHPVFMVVWIGSVVTFTVTSGVGLFTMEGIDLIFLITAYAIYMLGVMLPTARINIPLNNELQKIILPSMSDSETKLFRNKFESKWNRWNVTRTIIAVTTAMMLLIVLVLHLCY